VRDVNVDGVVLVRTILHMPVVPCYFGRTNGSDEIGHIRSLWDDDPLILLLKIFVRLVESSSCTYMGWSRNSDNARL
jgi:hypothetical protein